MEMVRLMDRMGSVPILSVKRTVSIGTMLYFDGDRDGDGTCKQAFTVVFQMSIFFYLNLKMNRKAFQSNDNRPLSDSMNQVWRGAVQ